MMALLGVFAVIVWVELRPLFRKGRNSDKIAACIIFFGAFTLCALQISGVQLPSPMMQAGKLMTKIGWVYPPLP